MAKTSAVKIADPKGIDSAAPGLPSMPARPISLCGSLLFFLFFSAVLYFGVYAVMPMLYKRGLSFFFCYLLGFQVVPYMLFSLVALLIVKVELKRVTLSAFLRRFRLGSFKRETAAWSLGLFVFMLGSYILLQFTADFLAGVKLFAPPAYFPAGLHPLKSETPGLFMGTDLRGLWWAPLAYFTGWLLNIFSEELLFRGYILPRQEAAFGGFAWVVNGSLFALFHVFWKWNLIIYVPMLLALSFVAQKTKSTWPGVIVHGALNFIPVVLVTLSVLGLA